MNRLKDFIQIYDSYGVKPLEKTLELIYDDLNKVKNAIIVKTEKESESKKEDDEEIITTLDNLNSSSSTTALSKVPKYKKYDIKEIYDDFLRKKRKAPKQRK